MEAGLPNITGYFAPRGDGNLGSGGVLAASGAFFLAESDSVRTAGNTVVIAPHGAYFDASRSSSVYGNSEVITPLSQSTLYILKY